MSDGGRSASARVDAPYASLLAESPLLSAASSKRALSAPVQRRERVVSKDLHGRPASWTQKLLFTLPQFSTGIMALFRDYWLGAFYANDVELSLGRIALVLSIYAGIHVVFNPIIGWIIDRYNGGRFGKKRPFIVIAALVQGITFAMLLSPPASGSQDAKFAWFLTFTVLSGLASVTLSTAYFAWAVQLTLNSGDRTWVFGMQRWFWQVGGLIGAAGPPYFVKWMGGDVFTTYRTLGMLAGGLTVVSYLLMGIFGREKRALGQAEEAPSVIPALIDSCYNVPFRRLMIVYCLWRLLPSVPSVIQNRFLFDIQHDTEQGLSFFIQYVLVAISLPVWLFVSRYIEKRNGFNLSLVFGELLPAVILVAAPSLPASWLHPAFIAYSIVGAFTARVTFEDAMLADCIEYDQLFSGKRREGQYQAAENTLLNFASIFRNAVGFAVLAAAGYQEGSNTQPHAVVTAARIVASFPIPVMFILQALMMGYNVTKKHHRGLVRALQLHQQGRPATDVLTGRVVDPPDLVDADTLSLISYFWAFERRWAITRGPYAALHAVWGQVALFIGVAAASMVGEALTHGVEELATVNNMLLNMAIVSAVLVIFNAARLSAAKRLATDKAALECLTTVTRPGMPLYDDPTFAPRFGARGIGDGEESVDSATLRRPLRGRRRGESVELHQAEHTGAGPAGAHAARDVAAAGGPRRQRSRRSSSRALGPGGLALGGGYGARGDPPASGAAMTAQTWAQRGGGAGGSAGAYDDHEPFGDV